MALSAHLFPTLILLLSICSHGLGSSVKIEVTTYYQDDVTPNTFNIRCSSDMRRHCGETIVLMKVVKDSHKTIAGIQRDDSMFYGRMLKSGVKAEGHVDRDFSNKTFFSVTVSNAVKEDTGLYSCVILYMDPYGFSREDVASKNVTIYDQDLQDVVRHLLARTSALQNMLKTHEESANTKIEILQGELNKKEEQMQRLNTSMARKMSSLVNRIEEEKTKLGRQVATRNRLLKTMSSRIDQLEAAHANKTKGGVGGSSASSAFSAYRTKPTFNAGEILVFKTALLNTGGDYNLVTGEYTAPKKGLYVFHLSLRTDDDDGFVAHLEMNNVTMASLYAKDYNYYDQSTVSSVISMDKGDKVWPRVTDGARLSFTNDHYTQFSGYILG